MCLQIITSGPTTAWNGDYHLNINVQQAYWGAGVANMQEILPSLVTYLGILCGKSL